MYGAMKKATPAASPALVASWSRGHSTAAVTLPVTVRASRRAREGWPPVSGLVAFAIPAHPRAAASLRQLDELRPWSAGCEAGPPDRGGQALGPSVGAALLGAPGDVAEPASVPGVGEAQGGIGAFVAEGQVAAEVPSGLGFHKDHGEGVVLSRGTVQSPDLLLGHQ